MIKSTLIGIELTDAVTDDAKAMLDRMWSEVLVDKMVVSASAGTAIH
jgi:hypothetical protein